MLRGGETRSPLGGDTELHVKHSADKPMAGKEMARNVTKGGNTPFRVGALLFLYHDNDTSPSQVCVFVKF